MENRKRAGARKSRAIYGLAHAFERIERRAREAARPRRERKPRVEGDPSRRKFVTSRRCLKCDAFRRGRYPGLCNNCKRHVDWKDGGEDDYTVAL